MVKNHAYLDGNKQMGLAATFLFLFQNATFLRLRTMRSLRSLSVWRLQVPHRLSGPSGAGCANILGGSAM